MTPGTAKQLINLCRPHFAAGSSKEKLLKDKIKLSRLWERAQVKHSSVPGCPRGSCSCMYSISRALPWKRAGDGSFFTCLSPASPWDLAALLCCLQGPFESHLLLLCPPLVHKTALPVPGLQDALVRSLQMLASGVGHPSPISDVCWWACISSPRHCCLCWLGEGKASGRRCSHGRRIAFTPRRAGVAVTVRSQPCWSRTRQACKERCCLPAALPGARAAAAGGGQQTLGASGTLEAPGPAEGAVSPRSPLKRQQNLGGGRAPQTQAGGMAPQGHPALCRGLGEQTGSTPCPLMVPVEFIFLEMMKGTVVLAGSLVSHLVLQPSPAHTGLPGVTPAATAALGSFEGSCLHLQP